MKTILIIFLLLIVVGCQSNELFYLDNEYYLENSFIEIESSDLKKLEDDKKSFIVFLYQPMCVASYDFEEVLKEFVKTYEITFYKLAFSDINDTKVNEYVKYYPSAVIYQNGKVIAYLDASSNNDLPFYESVGGFKKWVTTYIKLNNESTN